MIIKSRFRVSPFSNINITPLRQAHDWRTRTVLIFRILLLLISCGLIALITYDTLNNITFLANPLYLKIQLWVCSFFLLDIAVECALSRNRLRYLLHNILFIIVSIPYPYIIGVLNLDVPAQLLYLLRFMPLIRAAYVFALVTGIMSRNWVSSMLGGYLLMLVTILYCMSLMFYVEEHYVNTMVTSYWQALWFSIMQMTTCGSNISPVTFTGKVISVVLSGAGLVLFPVFTVYFTRAFARTRS
ncbi:MAG: potassium channel family protein [Muribaculaceae bacterium]|nr:potassium channel family protein [Muribaculaceae bacterium]